jgi:hypothetical protein
LLPDAPQQTASSLDHFVGATELRCGRLSVRLRSGNRDGIAKEKRSRPLRGAQHVRAALWTFGDPKTRRSVVEALDDIDNRLAGTIDVTAQAVARIERLFANSNLGNR